MVFSRTVATAVIFFRPCIARIAFPHDSMSFFRQGTPFQNNDDSVDPLTQAVPSADDVCPDAAKEISPSALIETRPIKVYRKSHSQELHRAAGSIGYQE